MARADTVEDKPAFRDAFRHRRCQMVADGFYEWQKTGGKKQPYFIGLKDQSPLPLAYRVFGTGCGCSRRNLDGG